MQTRGLLRALVVGLDLIAIVLGTYLSHKCWVWWRPHLDRILQVSWLELWPANPFIPSGIVLLACWFLTLRQGGLYDPARMTSSTRLAMGITRSGAIMFLIVMLLQFLLPNRTYSRFLIIAYCTITTTTIFVARLLFFRVQSRLPRPLTKQRVVVVGLGPDAQQIAKRISLRGHFAYDTVGFIRCGTQTTSAIPDNQILGSVSDIANIVNDHNIKVIVLATRHIARDEAYILATRVDQMGLRVLQVPFTWGVANPRVEVANLGDLQFIDLTSMSYPTLARQVKRTLDLMLVGVGGVLLMPLLGVVALAIFAYDRGPIFFAQPRSGKGNRQFPLLKFRSMVIDAEQQRDALEDQNEADGVLFKMRRDPRITPIGHFIRRWSIDELPQLWNVLLGDMNLVGPRPLPMRDLEGIEDNPEKQYWFEMRNKVKPGITGLWQVAGRSDLGFQEMVQLDIHYIQSWSLWLDVAILLKTIPAVLRGRGAR